MTWLKNKILNKSGLAAELWDDKDVKPDSLRKRLEQKNERNTLTSKEKKKIIEIFEKFRQTLIDSFATLK